MKKWRIIWQKIFLNTKHTIATVWSAWEKKPNAFDPSCLLFSLLYHIVIMLLSLHVRKEVLGLRLLNCMRGWKWKVDERGSWMKVDKSGWKWTQVDESEFILKKMDKRKLVWIKVDNRGWKWMKLGESV